MATVIFLTAVAFVGSALGGFLPQIIMQVMNVGVGIVVVFFGIKPLLIYLRHLT